MKIALAFRNELMGIPGGNWVVEQFDQLVAGINGVWRIEHNDNGSHANITAETVTTPEVLLTDEDEVVARLGAEVTADGDSLVVRDRTGVATAHGHVLADSARFTGGYLKLAGQTSSTGLLMRRNSVTFEFMRGDGLTKAHLAAAAISSTETTASIAVILHDATTDGIRLEVNSGVLTVREGDDSANAPLLADALILNAATTDGVRLEVNSGTLTVREGDDSANAPLSSGAQTIEAAAGSPQVTLTNTAVAVVSGDVVSAIDMLIKDNNVPAGTLAAGIQCVARGTHTASSAPVALDFYTTAASSVTRALRLRISSSGNVKINGTAQRATTEAVGALELFDGTAPVGTLANGVSLYSSGGKLFAMDAAGVATQLTP